MAKGVWGGEVIIEMFLSCALALPVYDPTSDYNLLREFIAKREPNYYIVFINEDEKLLNPGAIDTGINTVSKTSRAKGLRLWAIRRESSA